MATPSRRELLKSLRAISGYEIALAGFGGRSIFARSQKERHAGEERFVCFDQNQSPVLFWGDERTAFRDPAAIYHDGWFYLYFTYVRREQDGVAYSRLAWRKSRDLKRWTRVAPVTPEDLNLNYGSPGDVTWFNGHWVLCLQSYPRPHGEKYGNKNARIFTMRSINLEQWSRPQILRLKGPDVPVADMGRMIDPYLFADKDDRGKWWCIYKQNGLSKSWSHDLETWTFAGSFPGAENPCVIVDRDEYVLFDSPRGGIGVKRSSDLRTWRDAGILTLGLADWPWAQGRLTAGFVLDLRQEPNVGKAILFFHGSRFAEEDPRGGFDSFASIGFAWSDDLEHWSWGKLG
jgi:hypothetical protein